LEFKKHLKTETIRCDINRKIDAWNGTKRTLDMNS